MTRSAPLPAVKPKPQGGPWRTVGDCERPPLGGLAPARVISPSQAHMKYEAHGGLRGRNSVLGRRASCVREGGRGAGVGVGDPLEARPERACVPGEGGWGWGGRGGAGFEPGMSWGRGVGPGVKRGGNKSIIHSNAFTVYACCRNIKILQENHDVWRRAP